VRFQDRDVDNEIRIKRSLRNLNLRAVAQSKIAKRSLFKSIRGMDSCSANAWIPLHLKAAAVSNLRVGSSTEPSAMTTLAPPLTSQADHLAYNFR